MKIVFAKDFCVFWYIFPPFFFYLIERSEQFIILWIVFCFGFCSLLVMSWLDQDDKINFGCMQSWFHSFIQAVLLALYSLSVTSSTWAPKTFLTSCALFPDVVYFLCLIVSVSLPSTISFSLLISLFHLLLPSFLVVTNPLLAFGR